MGGDAEPRREKGFKTTFYGFRAAVRGFRSADPCKLDFAAFRRGVEEFVNSEH